ncbi:MAG TPA: A/G-specific adenine glycosylase [Planctomycetes bacterium]|nr:A/G-specific adenine glycosylase [Planctomycetota bacterium]HIL36732.1 A/G-specific adenine glycosylase [Planctomycetota bacterium]
MVRVSGPSIQTDPRLGSILLHWYDQHARDLPWRRTRDPYSIWISEIMLQQTRVEVVQERWLRFLARFPNVSALARAAEEEVVAEWAGLGYYRRARSIHRAACMIEEQHAGVFPTGRGDVLDLPGIGAYTAGAITSIAFGQQEALVDGNVERVFARLFQLDEVSSSASLKRRSWELARALVPKRRPGDWNQALMELGATVCTPSAPDCGTCPVREICACDGIQTALTFPRPKARPEIIRLQVECLLICRGEEVLLVRRALGGRMGGLYELPTREIEWDSAAPPGIFASEWSAGLGRARGKALARVSHTITRHRIQATIRRGIGPRQSNPGVWAGPEEWSRLGLTGMAAKALSKSGCEIVTLPAGN